MTCLRLCAPVGMSEYDQTEWVKVARATLREYPLDLLKAGCEVARKTADHPAKIVPAIIKAIEPILRSRKENQLAGPMRLPRPPEHVDQITPEQVKATLDRYGFAGIGAKAEKRTEPLRRPTRQDYRDLGVSEADIDAALGIDPLTPGASQ